MRHSILLISALLILGVVGSTGTAAIKYWDINGASPGAGSATPAATWNTNVTSNWNTASDGTGTPVKWLAGDDAVFSAGGDATGAFTIIAPGPQTASSVLIEEGTVSLGSNMVVAIGGGVITINAGAVLSTDNSAKIDATTGAGAKVILNGGNLRGTNPGSGGSLIDADEVIELNGGGIVDYTTANSLSIINPTTIISGTGPLTKEGVGIIGLASSCTYTGDTIINAGELRLRQSTNRLPIATNVIINGTGILNVNGSVQNQTIASLASSSASAKVGLGNGTLTINGSTDTVFKGAVMDTANYGASPTATINGRIVKSGSGSITFNGLNDLTGSVTLTSGGITVGPLGSLCGDIADLNVNGGTLTLNNAAEKIENLASTTTLGTISLGAGHVLTTDPTASTTYSGTITGDGGLTKANVLSTTTRRTLTLTGNNTYLGGTTINGGTLLANNAAGSATGAGPVTVQHSGGTFPGILGGTGAIAGTVTANSGGTIAPGTTAAGKLTVGGAAFTSGSTFAVELGGQAEGLFDLLAVNGSATIDGGTLSLSLINSFAPVLGYTFKVLTTTDTLTKNADFTLDTTNAPAPSGTVWKVDYQPTFLELQLVSAVLAGDYNNNGTVDAADYVLWRKGGPIQNETGSPGTVDGVDLSIWRANFGHTSAPGAGSGSSLSSSGNVPEPTTLALLLVGLAGLANARRRSC